MNKITNIDQYILSFPQEVSIILEQIRSTIQKAVPSAEETISYSIPTFKLNGIAIIHFAAYKNHIGLYATPTGHKAFKNELSSYKQGKGSVQFPINKPMPLALIAKIAKYNIQKHDT